MLCLGMTGMECHVYEVQGRQRAERRALPLTSLAGCGASREGEWSESTDCGTVFDQAGDPRIRSTGRAKLTERRHAADSA